MVYVFSRRIARHFFDGGKVAEDLFEIYYDLFSAEDDADFQNRQIPEAYARVIRSVNEKVILKDFAPVELSEAEQICAVARQRAINQIRTEEVEKMRNQNNNSGAQW